MEVDRLMRTASIVVCHNMAVVCHVCRVKLSRMISLARFWNKAGCLDNQAKVINKGSMESQ